MVRKLLVLVGLCVANLICYPQDFLNNRDYVYGVGMSDNEQEAEETAMLSLSRALYTKVVNESELYVEEIGGSSKTEYKKKSELTSNSTLTDTEKFVSVKDGKYVVYCYFNKTEYVKKRTALYSYFMNLANEYGSLSHPHSLNLTLGGLYRAYCSVDTDLMMLTCPQAASMKKLAMDKMQKLYRTGGPLVAHQLTWYSMEVYQEGSPWPKFFPVAAFEYFHHGKWDYSSLRIKGYREKGSILIVEDQSLENVVITYAPATGRGVKYIQYRWLYEEMVNGETVKIDVPDDFYFTERVIQYV